MLLDLISLHINNQEVKVPRGASILEACKELGLDIPRFCYHEKLSVAGNCRMCLVEIEKSPKPVASCAMPVVPNIKIYTDSPLVKKARENVLEILLLNHPLDCPICDQGGECDLQDQTRLFGGDSSRFHVVKRSVEDKDCGPLIKTIMTRCIHCTRCVRFAAEIAGVETLGTLKRGEETEIGTYISEVLNTEIAGNVIDLCPVGALTSKPYAFTSRPWELRTASSIDVFDCVGSPISVNFKDTSIVRIFPRYSREINEEWISDKVRFSYDGFRRTRVHDAYQWVNKNRIKFYTGVRLFQYFVNVFSRTNILIPIQSSVDTLTLLYLKILSHLKNFRIRLIENISTYFTNTTTIEDIVRSDTCFLVGINLRAESPILQIRLRTQFLKGEYLITQIGSPCKNTVNTNYLSVGVSVLVRILSGKSLFQEVISQSKRPFFFIGKTLINRLKGDLLIKFLRILNKSFLVLFVTVTPNLKALEVLGFKKLAKTDLVWADTVFSLNLEENYYFRRLVVNTKKLVWMATTHGSSFLGRNAHLILPVATCFEAVYSYVNTEGREQKTGKVLPCLFSEILALPSLTKRVLNIVKVAQFEEKAQLNYTEVGTIYSNPNNFILTKFKEWGGLLHATPNLLTNYPLKSNLEDYYVTNNKMLQASVYLSAASQYVRKRETNFLN